jgi:hypothetical protein
MMTTGCWSRASLLLIVSAFLLTLTQPAETRAQTGNFTANGKVVAILSETKMLPGDKPGHELTMVRRMDTITYSDPIFNSGQAVVAGVTDYTAGSGPHRGYFAVTHPTGDKTFTSYEGMAKATPKAGGPPDVTFEGKWSFVGGTGKFDGITGGGTYKGGVTAAGPAYEFGGQYTLKQ